MTHTEQAEVWRVRESVFIKYETLGVSSSEIIYLEINTLRFSESELLFWEFWPLSLIIYILYSQEISKFDPDVRCLCVSEFLLLPNKKPLIASSKS